jgi:Ni,Fe-hydrogenase III small subunit
MRKALERTWAAVPTQKWVVAAGACVIDGGLFAGGYAGASGAATVLPVALRVPDCPPSPASLLTGLLALTEGSGARS